MTDTARERPYLLGLRIAELLDRLARVAREQQFIDGLNPAQWEALRYVARANNYSRSPTAFAEFIGTTKGTASQTLIALEQKGLIERARSEVDRRQVQLKVTEEGEKRLAHDPLSQVARAATQLPPDTAQEVVRGLAQVLLVLQTRQGLRPFGVCADCTMLCVADQPDQLPTCRDTGDPIVAKELERLCIYYESDALAAEPAIERA